mgnify:CR=1 FL=1
MSYAAFVDAKRHYGADSGFAPTYLPAYLYDFQRALVEWACVRGRAALFADCGLGKTPMQLAWAENVVRHTGGRVLILAPLAVAHQTVREGEKFGVDVERSHHGELNGRRIVVANYQRLHHFSPADFVGVVLDESSILKSFDGTTRGAVTEFMRTVPYRLLATATAAPNDYIELGTSSEALGGLGFMDMLTRYFRNERGAVVSRSRGGGHEGPYRKSSEWRFKGHAATPFWRWCCSWARALRKPSDLGCDDGPFVLPPLVEARHVVAAKRADGLLFALPAVGLQEQRVERRRTIAERCEQLADLVRHDRPAIAWCHLNEEGTRLARLIPDSVEVSGADADDEKEAKLAAFCRGDVRCLVSKPVIAAWGLNLQHCAHIAMFPSHSYEQYYQAIRRCWRFGQTRTVTVDIVTTEGEADVLDNMRQKSARADQMFAALVAEMRHAEGVERRDYTEREEVPQWL